MNKMNESFQKLFGDMYLADSKTAQQIFEYGYKAGLEEAKNNAAWARHLKEPMSEKRVHKSDTMERECNPHPDAPHGFNRDASHGLGRYVCDCEGWEPPTVSQELQAMPKKTDDVAQETQPEQEPVAWMYSVKGKTQIDFKRYPDDELVDNCIVTPLYTAPPKRKWVGLTDDEIAEGAKQSWVDKQAFESAAWWAEEKLKEKNRG